jgi:glutaminyl-tRNA synthetase
MPEPPPKFFRLSVGREVRLMGAYIIQCESYTTDDEGNVKEIFCTIDAETGGKAPPDGRKVKGTIHWLSEEHCVDSEIRTYDRLFMRETVADIEDDKALTDYLNPDSVQVRKNAKLEESLAHATISERFQFVRNGYYIRDSRHEGVFNSIVALKDTWAKMQK